MSGGYSGQWREMLTRFLNCKTQKAFSLGSVSYRFYIANFAVDASVAVAHCTLLHARPRLRLPVSSENRLIHDIPDSRGLLSSDAAYAHQRLFVRRHDPFDGPE